MFTTAVLGIPRRKNAFPEENPVSEDHFSEPSTQVQETLREAPETLDQTFKGLRKSETEEDPETQVQQKGNRLCLGSL